MLSIKAKIVIYLALSRELHMLGIFNVTNPEKL